MSTQSQIERQHSRPLDVIHADLLDAIGQRTMGQEDCATAIANLAFFSARGTYRALRLRLRGRTQHAAYLLICLDRARMTAATGLESNGRTFAGVAKTFVHGGMISA